MKVHNIVIAGRTESGEVLNKVAAGLRSSARLAYAGQNPVVSVIPDFDSVEEYVSDGDLSVLIAMERLNSVSTGQEVSISQKMIDQWAQTYPEMTVILIVHSEKKGGVKLNKLYEGGFYNAIYNTDFKLNTLIELIQNKGRSKAEAYSYYGLKANAGASEDADVLDMEEENTRPRYDEDYDEEPQRRRQRPQQEEEQPRPKKKQNKGQGGLMYVPKDDFGGALDDDDDEEYEERSRREKRAPQKPERRPSVEDDDGYYDDDDDTDDRRSPSRRPAVVVPASEDMKFFFGDVESVNGSVMTVRVPMQNGTLDRSFEGTQVFFMGSVR